MNNINGPPITSDSSLESLNTGVTIPENLPLSDAEKSVLSKGLKFVPMSKELDEFSIKQDVEKFLYHVKLNVFFHDKKDNSNTSDKDIFETLQTQNSKWTPPPPQEGQFASLDIFINKCHHDSNKLNFNHNTKFPNLSSEERTALEKLSKRRDIIIVKVANKSSALVVWQPNVYPNKACSSFLTLLFMLKSIKISLPLTNKLSRALLTTL